MTQLAIISTIFSSFTTIDWLIYVSLVALLIMQIGFVLSNHLLTSSRRMVRMALNIVAWLVLLLFIVQPQWHYAADTSRTRLFSENIPPQLIQQKKDSLHITESFSTKELSEKISENPNFADRLGVIYLLGQDFSPADLSQLSQKNSNWLPYFNKNECQEIRWKALVRKGEMQEITGKIEVTEPNLLSIKYANQVLDSVTLQKGFNSFTLRFPTYGIGRTETELLLGQKSLQKIAFYTRKNQPFGIQFILKNPDFESKSLAEWLGKNGNQVEITATIAKNAQNKVSINKVTKQAEHFTPDIFITDPSNAGNSLIKKAVADGKSVLFLNVSNPELDLKTINQALGTHWHAQKTSNEEFIKIGENLTSLPYKFGENITQKTIAGYPVAIQKVVGKVGVSLLNETFPLKLSGDSLTYGKIWSSIFQQLNASFTDNIEVFAPLFQATQTNFSINNSSVEPRYLKVANDTTWVNKSVINSLSSNANFIFRKMGWQPFQDSLEVYVEENSTMLSKSKQIEEFLLAHAQQNATQFNSINSTDSQQSNRPILGAKLPDWAWCFLFLLSLTLLWLEPKWRF